MIKLMEKELIIIKMEPNMLEIGWKINNMVLEQRLGWMELDMKGNMSMEERKEQENSHGQMELYMKDLSKIIILKVFYYYYY